MECFSAIIGKGMPEMHQKLQIVSQLGYLDILQASKLNYPESTDNDGDAQAEEEKYLTALAESILRLGQWALQLYMHHEKMLPQEYWDHY
jgi:hypothetical protein